MHFDTDEEEERPGKMENMVGLVGILVPIAALLLPVGILGIIFWYKAHEQELEMHESLRVREFEHLERLKDLELKRMKASLHEKSA